MKVSGVTPTARTSRARAGEKKGTVRTDSAASFETISDVTNFCGLSESDLTPKVRQALQELLSEVAHLHQAIDHAHSRIEYLEQLSDEDTLVPLLNRRAFVRELDRYISFSERYDIPSCLLYFDLDGMKSINDSYGHTAGDAVLLHVTELMRRNLRGSDVLARLGGDEFGAILVQADRESTERKAADLVELMNRTPLNWEGHEIRISASWGVYRFEGREQVEEALRQADDQMYARKRQKKKQIEDS